MCDPFEQRWSQTQRVWQQFAQLDLMMERTGADPIVAARRSRGVAMAQARDACLRCPLHRECRNWLETTEGLQDPPEFCPNAPFFRECARRSR